MLRFHQYLANFSCNPVELGFSKIRQIATFSQNLQKCGNVEKIHKSRIACWNYLDLAYRWGCCAGLLGSTAAAKNFQSPIEFGLELGR